MLSKGKNMREYDNTDSQIIETTCPMCGKTNKTKVIPIISSTENPKETQEIMDDTFFDRTCKHCGEIYYLDYPAMYRSEENFSVVCYTPDDEGEVLFIEELEQAKELYGDAYEMCTTRIVRDKNSFREKARIFAMDYDDRLIEMFKVWGLEFLRENKVEDEISHILCWVNDDGSLEFSFFAENEENGYILEIPYEEYEDAKEELLDLLDEMEEDDYYIDFDWAMRVIAENDL